MERYTLEQHKAYVEEQERKRQVEEETRRERAEKGTAKRAWIADGGRAEDFEKAWPKLRDEARRQRVMDADKRAREEMRHSAASRI